MSTKTTRNTICAVIFTAACAAPFAAIAAEDAGLDQSVTVSYSDLDLASVDGQDVLYMRLKQAAKSVCGSQDIKRIGLSRAVQNRQCYEVALEQAQVEVHTAAAVAMAGH